MPLLWRALAANSHPAFAAELVQLRGHGNIGSPALSGFGYAEIDHLVEIDDLAF